MRKLALLIALAGALTAGSLLAHPSPGRCANCVPTFCGTSSECPQRCVCVVPQGEATGHCAKAR